MPQNEAAQGLAGLLIIGALGYCYCSSSSSSDTSDASSVSAAAEERAEDAALMGRARDRFCTPEIDREAAQVLHRMGEGTDDMGVAYVHTERWEAMNIDERSGFAAWAAVCQAHRSKLSIRDGKTGDNLKGWSLEAGFIW